ncbi:hypothetical protein C8R44DRAFT_750286 [Mycena epipterygia]|nr:hypothetical protein C8R44DRAFT_750286 [Mycena epipterygia]
MYIFCRNRRNGRVLSKKTLATRWPHLWLSRITLVLKSLFMVTSTLERPRFLRIPRILQAGKDTAKKLAALYGPVLFVTSPLKITVHGSCINAGKTSATLVPVLIGGPTLVSTAWPDCTVLKRARELNFWR